MLPPEEQAAAAALDLKNPFLEETSQQKSKYLKSFEVEFVRDSEKVQKSTAVVVGLKVVEEEEDDDPSEKCSSELFISDEKDFEKLEDKTETGDGFLPQLETMKKEETEEKNTSEDNIVRAKFVDLSGSMIEEEVKGEDLGKEFSLTLNPDLPKIRAQQIKNWLEFEKESEKKEEEEEVEQELGESPPPLEMSRESSPQDFDLDSLTNAAAEGGIRGRDDTTTVVTDADGKQRRVRFLTDSQGNILISVFLTNGDGEEEEQQQMIMSNLGIGSHENVLMDGMNFPEIESQLAALVQSQQKGQAQKTDLIDTDKILKELGVEKDESLEADEKDKMENDEENEKLMITLESNLDSCGMDESEDVGSDVETSSTSSCSSMIEVKPKEQAGENFAEKMMKLVDEIDENNNEVVKTEVGNEVQYQPEVELIQEKEQVQEFKSEGVTEDRIASPKKSLEAELSEKKEQKTEIIEIPKFKPKLVEIEMKNPAPPPAPIIPVIPQLKAFSKNGGLVSPTCDRNVVTVEVNGYQPEIPSTNGNMNFDYGDEAEQQLESLCIEEEPISAVALTIAKWESFSKKQQQQAESGERVNMAVKGLGKMILPMYNPHSAPIKMLGLNHNSGKAMLNNGQKMKSNKEHNKNILNININSEVSPGHVRNNASNWSNNNNNNVHGRINAERKTSSSGSEEEESIYAQPNSQAGSLNISTSLSNPCSVLKSYPKPNSRGDIINWFKEGEIHRSGILLSYGQTSHHSPHQQSTVNSPIVVSWFFGLITRQQAEELLSNQPNGTFIVRISTRLWGYTLSYQFNNKTKHFLISAINPAVPGTLTAGNDLNGLAPNQGKLSISKFSPGGKYQFVGTNMTPYTTLTGLIRHHSHAPITKAGQEKLVMPCPEGSNAGIEFCQKVFR